MKEIKSSALAFSYAGCFIGAGFLSGQELWQFFGSFGKNGLIGLIIAILLQAVLGFVIIHYAKIKNESHFDRLIIRKENNLLRGFFALTEIVFIFFIVTIMVAGAGSLFESVIKLDSVISSLIFTVLVMSIAIFGLSGVVKIFSLTVPLLTIATIIVSIITLFNTGIPDIWSSEVTGKTAMLPNFFTSAILFAIHNLYCTLGIIVPIGYKVKDNATIVKGMSLASTVLLLISIAVLLPIYAIPSYSLSELPMLEIAKDISGVVFVVFVILMAIGMFGTAVSNTVAISDFFEKKFTIFSKYKFIIPLVIGVIAFLLSSVGFSDLIAVLYPLTGYIGIIAIILIIINYVKSLKENERN